eukprot:GHUV01008472.1.p1 GENE.GHUV01008472.1~~GHUV01008472.1.p1  ORF type:complete len:643 (+),score=300.01 GHUV01008472.1:381-2309(+)
MAAPYASASGLIKLPAEMPAATAGLLLKSNQGFAAAGMPGMPGQGSSRQGSLSSSFFDSDSVFEAGCNTREAFLLPEDLDEGPFSSTAGLMMSSPPAAAASPPAGTTSSNWLSGIATAAGARSPLVSASTVAALMADDTTPHMELLQLDGDLAVPGSNPFGCLNEDASEQLLSLYEPAPAPAAAPDVTGLFDAPDADSGSNAVVDPAAAAAALPSHKGMVSLTASMAAAVALRRGQQDDSSSNSMASSSEHVHVNAALSMQQQQLQQQQMYTLVLLDGSTNAPLTAAAGARDAEQLSMMMGNSPTKAATAMHQALGHGMFGQAYAYSNFAAVGKKAAAGAAAAVLDNTFSAAAAADTPRGGSSGRGRPGRPKGSAGRPSKAAAAAKAAATAAAAAASASISMQPSLDSHGMTSMTSAALAAATMDMVPVMNSSSSRRSSEAGDNMVLTDPAAAAAMTRSDSGSAGDSSNESATQQQDDASKGPASHLTVAVPAPTAVSSASKHNNRAFHHKGGGPCDHCGVLESPQWRRGPPAKPILCNACGTRYRRTHNLGPPIPSSGRPGGRQGVGGSTSSSSVVSSQSPTAAGHRQHGNSSAGGRKRPAPVAVLQTPVVVNMNGGVHTGTRSGGSPAVGRRPVLKMARS